MSQPKISRDSQGSCIQGWQRLTLSTILPLSTSTCKSIGCFVAFLDKLQVAKCPRSEVSHSYFANLLAVTSMSSPPWWKIYENIICLGSQHVWPTKNVQFVKLFTRFTLCAKLTPGHFGHPALGLPENVPLRCWGVVYLVELSTTPETARETQLGEVFYIELLWGI